MSDINSGHLFVPSEGRPGLTSIKLNAQLNGATINPSFVASKPAVSSVTSADQLLLLKADGTYARVPATAVGGGGSGTAGQPAYTNSTASFTVPAVGSTVTVPVVNTSWATLGEILWIQDAGGPGVAGPMQITAITPTSLTLLNIATSTLGVFTRTVDGLTPHSGGTTGTSNFLREDGTWNAPVTGSPAWNPATGLYLYDDLFMSPGAAPPIPYTTVGNAASFISYSSTYGVDTTKKVNGSVELHTGTSTGTNQSCELYHGWLAQASPWGSIPFSLGSLVWKTRVFIEGTLPTTAIGYRFQAGIAGCIATAAAHNSAPPGAGFTQGFGFAYSPDVNSGNWVIYIGAGSIATVNTSVTVAGDTAYWLECDINAAWNSFTFFINGSLVATVTTGLPTIGGNPFWNIIRGIASAINFAALIDAWYLNYQFSR